MKRLLLSFAAVMLLPGGAFAQSQNPFTLKKADERLYFLYFDSSAEKHGITKSTLVEFSNFIALIEMPIGENGGNQKSRTDLTDGGEALAQFLQKEFPKKPLKYIFSTHWHEHSISSVLPFIHKGVKVVTTKDNFEYISQMLGDMPEAKYREQFVFVEDSIVIKDRHNTVTGYRFTKKDYPSVPTKDYVYYYLPRYGYMNISCMYHRYGNAYTLDGKEIVYPRTEDLYRFFTAKNIHPRYVIRTYADLDEPNGMIAYDTIAAVMKKGVTETEIKRELVSIDKSILLSNPDTVVNILVARKISGWMINGAVYTALKEKRLEHALGLARILCLLYPTNTGYWDTYGEAYYFLGKLDIARRYEKICKTMDKDFSAGEHVWEQDLKEYRELWAAKGL